MATSLAKATGVDLWEYFLASQLGSKPPSPRGSIPAGRWPGVFMVRQATTLQPAEIATLPGVVSIEPGNTEFAGSGEHSCDCSHYVYVDAADEAGFERIGDAVGGVHFL